MLLEYWLRRRQNGKQESPVSPKIKHGAAGGVGVGMLLTVLQQASHQFGDFAGDWTPVIFMAAVVAATAGVGYVKGPKRAVKQTRKFFADE